MAATPSTMLPLGTPCPPFLLPDFGAFGEHGRRMIGRDQLEHAPASVVMFICNHCPFVIHVQPAIVALASEFPAVRFVAINANNTATHPEDAPSNMTAEAKRLGYTFPYLFDERQDVAKAFHAACTPDFYVFGPDLALTYRGQLDDSRPGSAAPPSGDDLRAAIGATLRGGPPIADQRPSIGCNIKWIPGNEPDYARPA